MANQDTDATWKYHNGTKHSPLSIRAHPHFLDWDNKPLPFKIYPTLEVSRLPKHPKQTGVAALSAIANTGVVSKKEAVPDLETIAQLLFFSAGVTKSKKYPGGEIFFRAAACTGALYEIELYLVCADLPELSAGIYHFGVAEFGLRQLRAGDFRETLVKATADEPSVAHAPLIIVCTGTYWRNAWKYRSRTYRHFGWDNGTILANLLAMSSAVGLPAKIVCGFVDAQVNSLLDLDTQREVAFSLVPIGHVAAKASAAKSVEKLDFPTVAYSKAEVDYPPMRQMHNACSLDTPEEVAEWHKRDTVPRGKDESKTSAEIPLKPLNDAEIPRDTIEQVIVRRGSTRKFSHDPITLPQLSTLLDRATRGIPADFLNPTGTQLNELYLLVNNIAGLTAGAYFHNRDKKTLSFLKEGNFREQ